MHHPRDASAHGCTAGWFHPHQFGVGVHEPREDASGIGAAAHTRNDVLRIGTVEDHPALLVGLVTDDALELALEAGVQQLVLFHHKPERSDEEIDQQLEQLRASALRRGSTLRIEAAAEGMSLTV